MIEFPRASSSDHWTYRHAGKILILCVIALVLIVIFTPENGATMFAPESVPPCASDDFNSTGLPQCYVIDGTGERVYLDAHDERIPVS